VTTVARGFRPPRSGVRNEGEGSLHSRSGRRVRDLANERVGIVRAVMDPGNPFGHAGHKNTGLLAYLAPVGGGIEWTTDPDHVVAEPE
jgi:hypothetical protein